MVIKEARKPSSDPVQEKLRESKAAWNKEVSAFIDNLIHVKKLMNGWPSKFNMERSFIKDPIPKFPNTILADLAEEFNRIVDKGNKIITEQANYSKARKQRHPKQLNLPGISKEPNAGPSPNPSATPDPDLSKQLSLPMPLSASEEYALVSEASNVFTRFFTRLLNPAIGMSEAARIKRYRMSLLGHSARLYKDLGKLQNEIVGSGTKSILNANKTMNEIVNSWSIIVSGFNTYKNNLPQGAKNTGGVVPAPNMGQPTKKVVTPTLPLSTIQPDLLLTPAKELEKKTDDLSKQQELDKVKKDEELSKMTTASEQMEIVAQQFLTKWVGKTRHQSSLFDKSSSARLDVYNKAESCRKNIDQIMNSLEKGLDIIGLDNLINEVSKMVLETSNLVDSLVSEVGGVSFKREKLQKLQEQRQARELAKMYSDK